MMRSRTLRVAVCLGGLTAVAQPPARAQVLRVMVGDEALARAEAFTARGYPAFPLTVLTPLGAEIRHERRAVIVSLFGDTLRFRPGQAAFWADGGPQPLYAWTFEKDEVLFLPQRFFTQWLPQRYPERISYEDGTLRLTADAAEARPHSSVAPLPPPVGAPSRTVVAPSPTPAERQRPADRDPDPFYGKLLGFVDARVAGVYDSNIDHKPVAQASYGTAGRLLVGIQSARSRPFLMVRYDLGLYRFANSERWNRATHDVSAELAPAFRRIRLRLAAAIRIGSWTEDRERADQIVLRPQIEARLTNTKTLNLYVAQRARRIGSDTDSRSDTSRLAGVWFYQWWHDGGWLLDGRYEVNASERVASRFEGWSAYSSLRIPVLTSARVGLKLSYDWRRYPQSFPGGGAIAREDHRWSAAVSLSREFAGGSWELGTEYELEENRSNEPYGVYKAQRVGLMVRRRW